MVEVRILRPGDEAHVQAFCARYPDTTIFFVNNIRDAGLVDGSERYQGTYAAAFEGDAIIGLAALYWNGALILEAPRALPEVVRAAVEGAGRPLQQILGRFEQTAAARDACGLAEASLFMDTKEILYGLDLANLRVPDDWAEGRYGFRLAAEDDLDLLLPWRIAYRVEAMQETETPEMREQATEGLRSWIASGRMWVLLDRNRIVSMTGFNAVTDDVVQVGGVWTPPPWRGRGYARAAVAASLLDAREAGAMRSILFTDEANHAAQACYEKLGYETIGDYGLFMFTEPHEPFGAA